MKSDIYPLAEFKQEIFKKEKLKLVQERNHQFVSEYRKRFQTHKKEKPMTLPLERIKNRNRNKTIGRVHSI